MSRHAKRDMNNGELANISKAGKCPDCGKIRYLTRKAAKSVLRRLHRSGHVSVYPCGDYWHIGHTPYLVRRGIVSKRDWC